MNALPDPRYYPLDSQVDDLPVGVTLLFTLDVRYVASSGPYTGNAAFGQSVAFSSLQSSFVTSAQFLSISSVSNAFSAQGQQSYGPFAPLVPLFAARKVVGVRKSTLTLGSLTGGSTVVQLDSNLYADPSSWTDVRSVQIQEVTGGPFTLHAARSPVSGPMSQLWFFGNGVDYQALEGRGLQFQRAKPKPGQTDAVEQVTAAITVSAIGDAAEETLRPVTLQPALQKFTIDEFPLSFPPDKQPVFVFGNLAAATQGKTEKPVVLGNGDSRAAFQTFPIPKSPLTYLVSKSATPPEVPRMVVTVDGLEWKQVASLISYGPKDQIYIVREDSKGQSFVQFGDGETGARLPSGVGNVACTYRTGVGAFGPLKPGATADGGARITGLDRVSLLDEATGGSQPEAPEKARQAAPGKIQSLGRLVSIRDYETETLGIAGVSAVSAAWEIIDGVPAIGITVLMETGRASEIAAVRQLLSNYNVCRGPQRHPIVVTQGQRAWVYIDAAIALAPTYLEEKVFPEVSATLADLFASASRRFGGPEYRSRIEGAIQNVPGVLWNSVTAFGILGIADDPKSLALPAVPRALTETAPCDAATLLSLFPAHVTLSAVAGPKAAC